MANQLYPKGREGFLAGDIDWDGNTIKAQLIDTALYTFSTAHDNLDDVAAGSRVGSAVTLGTKTVTDGVADAADPTFLLVTGATTEAMILYKDTGVESTSRLIAYMDTAVGLPTTPNGSDINVVFDNGANKIFKL